MAQRPAFGLSWRSHVDLVLSALVRSSKIIRGKLTMNRLTRDPMWELCPVVDPQGKFLIPDASLRIFVS